MYLVLLYRDETGYVTGWSKEIIDHVCQAANIDCRLIWDKWTNCFKSEAGQHSMGGQGLQWGGGQGRYSIGAKVSIPWGSRSVLNGGSRSVLHGGQGQYSMGGNLFQLPVLGGRGTMAVRVWEVSVMGVGNVNHENFSNHPGV